MSNQLLHIINQGESEQVEFKQNFNQQVIQSLVAFANCNGGRVVLGVSDKGIITGLDLSSESIQNWQNEIKSKTEPALFPDIESFTVRNKTIVIVSIPEYPVKPVALQGRFYLRKNNSNHLLSASEINDVYLKSIQTSWDSYPYPNAKYDDLNEQKIRLFIDRVNQGGRFKLIGTPYECLQKLRLIKNNVPTNAAMLLFSKEELFYNVHIGRFKTQSHIIDDKMVRGTLFEAVENTLTFIIGHLKVAFEITGKTSQRTEIFEYPLPALRELVLNAIIHRDYTSPTDIQIRIFDKEITIFNPGKLFGNLTIEDLKTDNYQAQSRNKLITEAFYLTKDIEKYGSGYRRIREYIANYPTMYFHFEENSGGYLVKLGYTKQKTVDVTKGVTKDVTKDVTKESRQLIILELLNNNRTITIDEIAEKLNVTRRTILREMEELKTQNKIKRIGGRKTGHWQITNS
jgi:ATP-dependent DNA helicase RecG